VVVICRSTAPGRRCHGLRVDDGRPFTADRPSRYFVGTRRRVGRVEILVDGTQWVDGKVELCLTVDGGDDHKNVPTDTARKIAAALIEVADEIDALVRPHTDTLHNNANEETP
jgi:N-acetylmuramoyl-L-alanine amidase CwlA